MHAQPKMIVHKFKPYIIRLHPTHKWYICKIGCSQFLEILTANHKTTFNRVNKTDRQNRELQQVNNENLAYDQEMVKSPQLLSRQALNKARKCTSGPPILKLCRHRQPKWCFIERVQPHLSFLINLLHINFPVIRNLNQTNHILLVNRRKGLLPLLNQHKKDQLTS